MIAMTLTCLPVAGFDCESTGTDVAHDRIVSAALVRRDADGTTITQTWLVNPGIEIPAAALAVHGITTQRVRDEGQDAREALDEIAQSLADCLTDGLSVLIYNASFDLRILDAELARHGLASLERRLGGAVRPVVDPLVIDRGVDRYRRGSRRLPDLMDVYGLPPSRHLHDALDDVVNAIAVFDAIMNRYPILPAAAHDLHDWQATAHREWATHFNEWLAGRGQRPTADPRWP